MTSPLRRSAVVALAGTLAVAGSAGCSSSSSGSSSSSRDDENVATAPVIAPGRPGAPATTYEPGEVVPSVERGHAAADVAFMVGMIPHHEQALELAGLAERRAADERVRGLAARISDVQQAEIAVYEGWLAERGLSSDGRRSGHRGQAGHGGHGGSSEHGWGTEQPHGMASAADIERLAASSGREFDRLWIEVMIRHHEGALEMVADREDAGGMDIRAGELAAEVAAGQAAEIRRMEAVLAELG